MNQDKNLIDILAKPEDERNDVWERNFFQALSLGSLDLFYQEPQSGPDGWPYLLTKAEADSQESFQKILHWLSDKGIGLVINPQKEYPDYVFTYGMLWHFKETGLFFKDVAQSSEGVFEFQVKDIKSAGEPSEAFLPLYVRNVLKEFFVQQGILAPKLLAFSFDEINFELAISLESLGNPNPQEHQGILEAIAWFLPPHYQVALLSEVDLPFPFMSL